MSSILPTEAAQSASEAALQAQLSAETELALFLLL